jgi:hypothetical protein
MRILIENMVILVNYIWFRLQLFYTSPIILNIFYIDSKFSFQIIYLVWSLYLNISHPKLISYFKFKYKLIVFDIDSWLTTLPFLLNSKFKYL